MPRPPNTEERRGQIVAGLMTVMAERGYDGASIVEIAKAAGLTAGLVHYHFKNKQEILLAAMDALVERHEARVEAQVEAAMSVVEEVEAFVDVHVGVGASADPEGLACWILMGGEAIRQPLVAQRFEAALMRMTERLEGIIAKGCDEDLFDDVDPKVAATALVATIQGYFMLAGTARALVPRGSAAGAIGRMAEGLLGISLPSSRGSDGQ